LKQLVAVLLGGLLAVAIAACGGDDEKNTTEQAQSAPNASETVTVRETEFKLDPANPRIVQAGSVEFKVENDGSTVHALEIEGPGGESKTDDIQPGGSATLTANLDKPGKYEWYCPVDNHRQQGMEGTITVGGGGSGTTETNTTETNTTTTGTTETNTTGTTETEPGADSGGSGGSGGSGSGGSGSSGSSGGYSGGY
jgi:plastocyanin